MNISLPANHYARIALGCFLSSDAAFTTISEFEYMGSKDGVHYYSFSGEGAPRDNYYSSYATVQTKESYPDNGGIECLIRAGVPYGVVIAQSECGEYSDNDSDATLHGLVAISGEQDSLMDIFNGSLSINDLVKMDIGNIDVDVTQKFDESGLPLGAFMLMNMEDRATSLAQKASGGFDVFSRPTPGGDSYFEMAFIRPMEPYARTVNFIAVERFLRTHPPISPEDIVHVIGRYLSDHSHINMESVKPWIQAFPQILTMRDHKGMPVVAESALHGSLRDLEAALSLGFDPNILSADGKSALDFTLDAERDGSAKRALLENLLLTDTVGKAATDVAPIPRRKLRL